MSKRKTEPAIDTSALEALLDELRDLHQRLGTELEKLDRSPRFSESYHDHLAEIYTELTWLQALSGDLKAEMDRLDDQLPEDYPAHRLTIPCCSSTATSSRGHLSSF